MFALELLVQQYAVSHPPQPISEFNVLNARSRVTHLIESADGLERCASNASATCPESCGIKLSGLMDEVMIEIFVLRNEIGRSRLSIVGTKYRCHIREIQK